LELGGVLVTGDIFTEVELVSAWIADGDVFHLPRARRERVENFNASGAKLGFECGHGAFDEVGALVAAAFIGSTQVNLVTVALDEGIGVAVWPCISGEP